jgi:phosphoenolpyruvate-protein phosphotransferase
LRLHGIPASPGCAAGPAFIRPLPAEATSVRGHGDSAAPDAEAARFARAVDAARRELADQRDVATGETAEILGAHLLMLDDPLLLDATLERIRRDELPAGQALEATVFEIAASLRTLDDEYLQGRAVDVEDVGRRIERWLDGGQEVRTPAGAVLVAGDVAPSDVLAGRDVGAVAIALEAGAVNSHAMILARALGLPAVVGVPGLLATVRRGDLVRVYGESGVVTIGESEPTAAGSQAGQATRRDLRTARPEARTADGRRVRLYANVGRMEDMETALSAGAEGVGVLRTEFLFLDEPPNEEHQYRIYADMATRLAGRPLIVRTLDAGGDKPLPYLSLPHEDNPYLGLRGLRLSLAHPDVFRAQLRGILRAAAHGRVSLMYPMVTDASELIQARRQLDLARAELADRGVPSGDVDAGAMIEVPAAALCAESLARDAAFLSVGTNDLTQYALAADRNNAGVAYLYSQTHPAVLRLLRATIAGGHSHGRPVAVCGEVAGDVAALPLLVGLGVDELSVSPHALERVREALVTLSYAECIERARDLLGE